MFIFIIKSILLFFFISQEKIVIKRVRLRGKDEKKNIK